MRHVTQLRGKAFGYECLNIWVPPPSLSDDELLSVWEDIFRFQLTFLRSISCCITHLIKRKPIFFILLSSFSLRAVPSNAVGSIVTSSYDYSSALNISRVVRLGRMKWTAHIVCVKDVTVYTEF
jgi:hypothetical protein